MVYYPVPLHKMGVFKNEASLLYGSLENAELAVNVFSAYRLNHYRPAKKRN